jgi:hypothetical protein
MEDVPRITRIFGEQARFHYPQKIDDDKGFAAGAVALSKEHPGASSSVICPAALKSGIE